jgi:hypothetical protein
MLGRTHYKLGIGYYLLFLPVITTIYSIKYPEHIITGIIVSAIAALLPDIDTATSKINQKNILTSIPIRIIEHGSSFFLYMIRLIFFVGTAYFTWSVAENSTGETKTALICAAALLFLIGISGGHLLRKIPVLGAVYNSLEEKTMLISVKLKRLVVFTVVISMVVMGFIYNYRTINNWAVYLLGFVLILSTVSAHRTFTHSIEGFLLYSGCVLYISNLLGHIHLGLAFTTGYMSHLYLADIFTNSGIPLSFWGYVLDKTGLHQKLRGKKLYDRIYKILSFRLKLSLFNTGSKWEYVYYLTLYILVGILWYTLPDYYTKFALAF